MNILRKIIVIFGVIMTLSSTSFSEPRIKHPNVSGQFYAADPTQLSKEIDQFFLKADIKPYINHVDIVIAPHAGYVYSGGVAAYGFKAASQNKYKTIIILAPSHYVGFDGISVGTYDGFQTPLGVVEVDQEFTKKLIKINKKFNFKPEAFSREHSLEVEIPFLQKTFKNFKIVPVIMGQPDIQTLKDFASGLNRMIGVRKDVLIVVSTDLSHYHGDTAARKMDKQAIDAVKNLDIEKIWKGCRLRTMEMCGFVPVTAALIYAKQRRLKSVDVLKMANSGDVSGDKDRVVGYSSMVIYNKEKLENEVSSLSLQQKKHLIEIAKNTITEYVTTGKIFQAKEPDLRLSAVEGAFVTIHKKGRLRGCIGNIIGRRALYLTVRDMAIAAASEDSRFSPVKKEELKDLDIEVSVLSKPRAINNIDEIELGVHGVIVSQGPFNQGVFLPQVAKTTGWNKEEFLSQLCAQKAHLPSDAWKDPKTKIEIFTADVFSEKDVSKSN